jgi:anaerobic selenocysteine-containing dehydrogenase
MCPDDATALGIAEGELIEVISDDGALRARVDLSASMRPGAVTLAHGWSGHSVSVLTSRTSDVDPLTGQPVMSAIPVAIAKIA